MRMSELIASREWRLCAKARTLLNDAIEAVRALEPTKSEDPGYRVALDKNDARIIKLLEVLASLDQEASALLWQVTE